MICCYQLSIYYSLYSFPLKSLGLCKAFVIHTGLYVLTIMRFSYVLPHRYKSLCHHYHLIIIISFLTNMDLCVVTIMNFSCIFPNTFIDHCQQIVIYLYIFPYICCSFTISKSYICHHHFSYILYLHSVFLIWWII